MRTVTLVFSCLTQHLCRYIVPRETQRHTDTSLPTIFFFFLFFFRRCYLLAVKKDITTTYWLERERKRDRQRDRDTERQRDRERSLQPI